MVSVFDDAIFFGQDRVKDYLSSIVENKTYIHAYLFSGSSSAPKREIAERFGEAILCECNGCGVCDSCQRVSHGVHPDLKYFAPTSTTGYVVETIREIMHDITLTPIQSKSKVYILDEADRLNSASANAFLKTLEEPPANVVMILLTSQLENVLETVRSRCQVVPFAAISPAQAISRLSAESGKDKVLCACAFSACASSYSAASVFINSPVMCKLVGQVSHAFQSLPTSNNHELLLKAKLLVEDAKSVCKELEERQKIEHEENEEFLNKGAMKALEERQKRERSSYERAAYKQLLGLFRYFLRSCLLVLNGQDASCTYRGSAEFVRDFKPAISLILQAIEAVDDAETTISYNVGAQVLMESLLLNLRNIFAQH